MKILSDKLQKLESKRYEILKWFIETDYIVNKVFLGEWMDTDLRFLAYKKERKIKRLELDQIELDIKEIKERIGKGE